MIVRFIYQFCKKCKTDTNHLLYPSYNQCCICHKKNNVKNLNYMIFTETEIPVHPVVDRFLNALKDNGLKLKEK
jgi:hypothetical protein